MRKCGILCGFLFVFVLGVSFFPGESKCGAEEKLLSEDPRLAQAAEALKEGKDLMDKGEREMSWNPGRSYEKFKQASSEFKKAGILYEELGADHDIRVVNEVQKCAYLKGRADVKANKARKEKGKKARGFL